MTEWISVDNHKPPKDCLIEVKTTSTYPAYYHPSAPEGYSWAILREAINEKVTHWRHWSEESKGKE